MKEKLMGIRPDVWNALRGRFSRMAIGLHGHSLNIITLPEGSDDIGMTDAKRNIYLNPYHELAKQLTESEAIMFIMGVFGHEDMHQHMTNFKLIKEATEEKPKIEQKIFHTICNIIEDPAIEHFASRFYGGKLLEALQFSIMHIYRQSPPLDEDETASEQFFSAMIQYGDGGLLKGDFSFPEARKTFREILPFFDKAIESFDSKTRLECMEKVYEISRPLWINEIEALNKLLEMLKKLGKDHSSSSGSGDPNFKPSENGSLPSKTEKRRKITFRKISKEEAEALEKSGEASKDIPNEGDIEILIVEDDGSGKPDGDKSENKNSIGVGAEKSSETPPEDDNGSSASNNSNKDDKSEKKIDINVGAEKPSESPSDDGNDASAAGSSNEEDDSKESPESESSKKAGDESKTDESEKPSDNATSSSVSVMPYKTAGAGDDSDDSLSIGEEEYKLTEERLKEIAADVEKMLSESTAATLEQSEADNEVIEVPEMLKRYNRVKCKNYRVTSNNPEALSAAYSYLVDNLSGTIAILTNQFKRIFRADIEERERRTSGKLNIKRLSTGTPSTRVFDRKRLPGNKKDTAILLLIDISLSMEGLKIKMAKSTAVLLAEVFAKFGIAVKVVGFTDRHITPQHYHYTSWKNTAAERPKILEISAKSGNYDGYSIRYAGELLKKRPEKNKLLIVVSDGYPASEAYQGVGTSDGINDTRNAVHEVSRTAKVFGVLIGNIDAQQHHTMYGDNLLHISKLEELPYRLAKKISTLIKDW